jgi:hypothetical protein
MREIKVGDMLYSTCAGENYGKILGVYRDENGEPVIDIEVFNINDVVHFMSNASGEDVGFETYWSHAELPEGVNLILRAVGYKLEDSQVVINIEGGCFRCSRCFLLNGKID